ncbi:MAG: hypothetical protein MI865_04885 [Proteobacteria bacterium]|nr:hypothetical protein [Pseudomonadota bacterium]
MSVACIGSSTSSEPEKAKTENYPNTGQEAIELILSNLNDEDKALLITIDKEKLKSRSYINGWGKEFETASD